jgi:squalene-hopene/tetraprenyl-beta-curcumene cyclase
MKRLIGFALVALTLLASQQSVRAADAASDAVAQKREALVARAVEYLKTVGQAPDGSFTKPAGIGVTGLVTTALLRNGLTPKDPMVAKSLDLIASFVQPDGGIYTPNTGYKNYECAIAVLCLTEANRDGKYNKQIAAAEAFLKGEQWDENRGKEKSDMFYGGAGYGKHKRPDLSNTQFLVDALKACGRGADDPAMQKALVFVSRCQNLESEHNTTPFAAKNPDGGFYYTCAAGGQSQAGETPTGGLRSYASMTYAGLKSMIYAGVKPDDPRVKAAVEWIKKFYDLDSNPGMGQAGLFYYYQTFAKALTAAQFDTVTDASGAAHNWRADLVDALAKRQRADGSWTNPQDRWMEGDPNLVTGYALLALSYCRAEK